jgi:hypothetical protein
MGANIPDYKVNFIYKLFKLLIKLWCLVNEFKAVDIICIKCFVKLTLATIFFTPMCQKLKTQKSKLKNQNWHCMQRDAMKAAMFAVVQRQKRYCKLKSNTQWMLSKIRCRHSIVFQCL